MNIGNFNGFDWLVVTLVIFSMIMAYKTGLVRSLFGLMGIIAGFQLATWTYDTVGDWVLASTIRMSPTTGRIVGFLLVVVIVSTALEVIGRLLQSALKRVGMSLFDRFLGVAFGFARGCLIGIGLLLAISTIAPQSEFVTASELSPYLFAVTHDVSFLVPQYLQQLMASGSFDFKHPPRWINLH